MFLCDSPHPPPPHQMTDGTKTIMCPFTEAMCSEKSVGDLAAVSLPQSISAGVSRVKPAAQYCASNAREGGGIIHLRKKSYRDSKSTRDS